jgi:hypothetical protein
MPDPIIEQLALAVVSELSNVTEANGYAITLSSVIREPRQGVDPQHLMTIISTDFEGDIEEIHGQGNVVLEIPVVFSATVYVTPSDDDPTVIDRLLHQAWADITKAMAANWHDDSSEISTLAREWHVLSPVRFSAAEGAFDGVMCRYSAMVRILESDPYTQR